MKIKHILALLLVFAMISISSYHIGYARSQKSITWFLPESVSTELHAASHIRNGNVGEALKLLEFQALHKAKLLKHTNSADSQDILMYASRAFTQSEKYIASYPESANQLKQ